MKKITTIGLDIAKTVFHLYAVNPEGRYIKKKQLKRKQVLAYMANIEPCLIAMEACGGANYWAREFIAQGHQVELIAPQYVKPYVKGNKNDYNDAEAIAEAVQRPSMRFVPIKTVEQQDIQNFHCQRERIKKDRTALVNQVRGLLAEYGIVINKGVSAVRQALPDILEDAENGCRRRSTGYPVTPAQIPACGFPAPGSSDTLTLVANHTLTQAPDFQFVSTRYSGVETLRAPVTALVAPRSSSVSDYVDSTICRVTLQPASKIPTRPRYPRH